MRNSPLRESGGIKNALEKKTPEESGQLDFFGGVCLSTV